MTIEVGAPLAAFDGTEAADGGTVAGRLAHQATEVTELSWPRILSTASPVTTFHTITILSAPPLAMNFPSGLQDGGAVRNLLSPNVRLVFHVVVSSTTNLSPA